MGLILAHHGRDVTPRRPRGQLRTAEKVVVGSRSRRKSGGSRFTAVRSFCSTLPFIAWSAAVWSQAAKSRAPIVSSFSAVSVSL